VTLARRLADARARIASIAPPRRGDWIFAIRTTAAGLVALSAAYALKLDNPQWAMMTVFIVAQPVAGMVLAKGFYRLAGTVVGALVALAITRISGGNALLFLAALALWIAASAFAASLLRNPEAYGAALSGYTAAIIALPAFGHPDVAHELALARAAEIMLGIACAGVASRFILPQLARDQIVDRLESLIRDLAAYAEASFRGAERAELAPVNRRIIAETQTLSEMRAYMRLEGPSLAARGLSVRRTIGQLLTALSAARLLRSHPPPPGTPASAVRVELHGLVSELAAAPEALDDTAPWIARLDRAALEARRAPSDPGAAGTDRIGFAARLAMAAEFAEAFREVLRGLDALRPGARGAQAQGQPALLVHRDREAASRNALRAAVATTLVAAGWLATQWADAVSVTIIVAVVSILFASRPAPVEAALRFFRGTLLAVPFAFLVGQLMLPALPGFGWFVLFVVPVLVPAALAMANPAYTGAATAFAINFLAFLRPNQAMVYAPQAFFNGTLSILAGILLAIGVFAVVLPARPRDTVVRIVAAIKEDLVRLCLHERIPRRSAFESLTYDRINQLIPFAKSAGGRGEAMLSGSVSAVTVGLEILRLRKTRASGRLSEEADAAIDAFLRRLARILVKPAGEQPTAGFVQATRRAANGIAEGKTGGETLAAAASLRVIAASVEDYPAFYRQPQ
jgi:uncharacterized membrane protein YccC